MKFTLTLLSLTLSVYSVAQYVTPNSGVIWNLDSLVVHSEGAVVSIDDDYLISEDIEVAENDAVSILIPTNVFIVEDVVITIAGSFIANSLGLSFTAENPDQPYGGFRFEEGSIGSFQNVTLEYGGGIKVITENFSLEQCQVQYNAAILNTGGLVEVSHGKPLISGNHFLNNSVSAISSAANASVAPEVRENIMEGNVTSNTNRPQINLGPSGAADTTIIVDNTIIGAPDNEMAGGIAVASLLGGDGNVVIRNNLVTGNRYGIAIVGNGVNALIDNNILTNNNIQANPFLGGSGINLNGNESSTAIVSNNTITGNHWGITIQNAFSANIGDNGVTGASPGLNVFDDNGNDGQLYALFNNTPNEISAQNNCWSTTVESNLESAEAVISHNVDDAELGEVIFNPVWSCTTGVEETSFERKLKIYPNPTKAYISIEIPASARLILIDIYSALSVKVGSWVTSTDIDLRDIEAGVYYVYIMTSEGAYQRTFVKQ